MNMLKTIAAGLALLWAHDIGRINNVWWFVSLIMIVLAGTHLGELTRKATESD